jgi:hypothetical protein
MKRKKRQIGDLNDSFTTRWASLTQKYEIWNAPNSEVFWHFHYTWKNPYCETLFYTWNYFKYCIKLSQSLLTVYMKHTWILCLNLVPILNISHYVYANTPKSEKKIPNQNHLWPLAFQRMDKCQDTIYIWWLRHSTEPQSKMHIPIGSMQALLW